MGKNIIKKEENSQKGGITKTVVIVIGILVLLKYVYDLDVIKFLTEGRFRELWDKLYEISQTAWNQYKDIIIKIWNFVWGIAKKIFGK